MPRIGTNPMKQYGTVHPPQRVTLVTSVFIPELAGYWRESLDVLKVSLESVRRTTNVPCDLLVFDNGSCSAVRDYLEAQQREGLVQYLVLSRENVGKIGCWNFAFAAAPGEFIAYFDSDVLFAPGWLKASLQVFEAFDSVGMVTARPMRHPAPVEAATISATLEFAERPPRDVVIERGDLIPRAWVQEHFRSCGLDVAAAGYPREDIRLTCEGVSVFAHAAHFQFVTRRTVAQQLLPLPVGPAPLAPRSDHAWDAGLNRLGLLRVSLTNCFVRHLGNSLRGESLAWPSIVAPTIAPAPVAAAPKVRRGNLVRRALIRLHAALGKVIYR